MALCESSNGRMRVKKRRRKLLILFLLILSVQAVKPSKAISTNLRVPTNNFELLMSKRDRTHSACEFGRKYAYDNER